MLDYLIFINSVFLGIISSIFIYIVIEKKLHSSELSKMDIIHFEKSIALEAINKVYLFSDENKINTYEKNKLLSKYSKLIDHYDKLIFQDESSLKIQELSDSNDKFISYISPSKDILNKKWNSLSEISSHIDKRDEKKDSHAHSLYSKRPNPNNNINQELLTGSLNSSISDTSPLISDLKKDDGKSTTHTKKLSNINNPNYFLDNRNNNQNNRDEESINGSYDSKFNEIDKIQDEILKTLKRLEDSEH